MQAGPEFCCYNKIAVHIFICTSWPGYFLFPNRINVFLSISFLDLACMEAKM